MLYGHPYHVIAQSPETGCRFCRSVEHRQREVGRWWEAVSLGWKGSEAWPWWWQQKGEAPVDEKVPSEWVTPWANWCITLCDGPDGVEITRQKDQMRNGTWESKKLVNFDIRNIIKFHQWFSLVTAKSIRVRAAAYGMWFHVAFLPFFLFSFCKISIRLFGGQARTIMLNCATYDLSFCLC